MRTLILLCCVVLAFGCHHEKSEAREAELLIKVVDDAGRVLPSVPVLLDDTPIATSDAQGAARAMVQAAQGSRVKLKPQCPNGYREPGVRNVSLAPKREQRAAMELTLVCVPSLRSLAVVVRAPGGEGLPLRADGQLIGKIQPDGTAHVLLARAPDTALRLTLDTSAEPAFLPQFPVREVQVSDRDEIVVFDQPFHAPPPKKPRPARRTKLTVDEPRHVPYAIGRRY